MDPDAGLGIGQESSSGAARKPRPLVLVRGLEMAGLGLVIYGLGSYRFGLVALAVPMILGSYALYRRTHGPKVRGPGAGPDGNGGPDGDAGGD